MTEPLHSGDAPAEATAERVRFGPYEADLRAGVLRKHDIRLRLAEQPFRILARLVRSPGELVTREELIELLWPDGTHVEFERSLNAAVKKLRRALNDSPTDPNFIQTLPKKGYRFIADVEVLQGGEDFSSDPANPSVTATAPAEERTSVADTPARRLPSAVRRGVRPSLLKLTAAAAGILVAIAAISWFRDGVGDPLVQAGPLRFRAHVLPGLPEDARFVTLSPDGTSIAFTAKPEQASGSQRTWRVYIASLDGGAPRAITNAEDRDLFPSWSPDGRHIAFVRRGSAAGTYVVSLIDRSETRLGMVSTSPPTWTPDAKTLIGTYGKIWAVSLETREERDLIPEEEELNYQAAAVSPDGQTLAFGACRRPSVSSCDVYVRPLEEGEPRRLTFANGQLTGLAWTPDSREIVYTMDGRLFRAPAGANTVPGRVELLTEDPLHGRFMNPSLARFGTADSVRMLVDRYVWDEDIWVSDISAGPGVKPRMRKVIDSPGADKFPQFSPDGNKIAFYSVRADNNLELWVCERDGTAPRRVSPAAFRARDGNPPSWSPDSRHIAFRGSTAADSDYHVYTIAVDGGDPRRVTSGKNEVQPVWSRDGLYIYFTANGPHISEVFRVRSDGRADGISTGIERAWNYVESPDGRYLYYCGGGGGGYGALWRTPVAGGEREEVLAPFPYAGLEYRPNGLHFVRPDNGDDGLAQLSLLDPESGEIIEVARVPRSTGKQNLSMSPDGRFVVTSRFEGANSSVLLVDDFR